MTPSETLCQQQLRGLGLVPVCPVVGCEMMHQEAPYRHMCQDRPPLAPVQGLGCFNNETGEWKFWAGKDILSKCEELHQQDPVWSLKTCYCCCFALAGAPIDVPGGTAVAASIPPNAEVLAGSLVGPHRVLRWRRAAVQVSVGVDAGWAPMVQVVFGTGEDRRGLVVPPDYVFLLADRTLCVAAKLVAGEMLANSTGGGVPVRLVRLGEQKGGVHHLATSKDLQNGIDDHLLTASGVVVGDYVVQLGFASIPETLKAPGHEQRPAIGTEEYRRAYPKLFVTANVESYAASFEDLAIPAGSLIPTTRGRLAIPSYARLFVTPLQAADIEEHGNLGDPRDPVSRSIFEKIVKELNALYPKVTITADWESTDVNVFSYRRLLGKNVVVGGGLAKRQEFSVPALTMVIAQGVSYFYGGRPQDDDGYSCKGEADFFSLGVISRKLWPGDDWLPKCETALDDIGALFSFIKPEHAKGNPNDPCQEPSIECRIRAMNAGVGGGSLPDCAQNL